jgi:phosphatidylglycerophosphatase A
MKKAIEFIKKTYEVCATWVEKNGIEGVLGLGAGIVLWIFGYKIWAGFSFGVFATRNWDILKSWVLDKFEV